MKPIRMLIVEDNPALLAGLEEQYREIFTRRGRAVAIELAGSGDKARSLAKQARDCPYDLVSLDINLGDSGLTGLDVLDTLHRFQSAWMVALLTGVETDETLDATMGQTKANSLRRRLRRDAFARFPAERLLVVEKPSATLAIEDAAELLANRLEQIALVYEEISRQRYIFRPLEVTSLERVPKPKGSKEPRKFIETTSLHWQIRFNCGPIRTLPNLAGFRTLHYLLSLDPADSVTPEHALVIEPKAEKVSGNAGATSDPVAEYFTAQGIPWNGLAADDQGKLIRAALSLKFNRYCELRGYQDEDDLSAEEEAELNRIVRELGALADSAETAYLRMTPGEADTASVADDSAGALAQQGLKPMGGNYRKSDKSWGKDSPAAVLFRARMKRVKDCLRENGFQDLAKHLEDYVMPNRANWSYNPPEGVEWTT